MSAEIEVRVRESRTVIRRYRYVEQQYSESTTEAVFVGDELALLAPCAHCGHSITAHGLDKRRPPFTCPPPPPISKRILTDRRPDAELLSS